MQKVVTLLQSQQRNVLNKDFRLKKNSSFKATYSQRRIVSDEFFVLYGGKDKENAEFPTKIGFVVSKKIHKRAVKRNRIKRLAREAVRLNIKNSETEFNRFQSLIYMAKEGALELDFDKAQLSVTKLINKLARKFI